MSRIREVESVYGRLRRFSADFANEIGCRSLKERNGSRPGEEKMHRNIVHIFGVVVLGFAATRTSGQTANSAAHAAMIEDLKKAHHLLVEAKHDYQGHRAKAAEEVHKVLKELGHHPKATARAKSGKGSRTREDQSVSDGQLREAQKFLAQSLGLLHKHHPKAHANIQAAIGEINVALSIR